MDVASQLLDSATAVYSVAPPHPYIAGKSKHAQPGNPVEVCSETEPATSPSEMPVPTGEASPLSEPAAPTVESDDSASASDVSNVPSEAALGFADEAVLQTVSWFRQGTKVHIVASEESGMNKTPVCRDFPFAQAPQDEGGDLSTVDGEDLCKRCVARAPCYLYEALASLHSWSY